METKHWIDGATPIKQPEGLVPTVIDAKTYQEFVALMREIYFN